MIVILVHLTPKQILVLHLIIKPTCLSKSQTFGCFLQEKTSRVHHAASLSTYRVMRLLIPHGFLLADTGGLPRKRWVSPHLLSYLAGKMVKPLAAEVTSLLLQWAPATWRTTVFVFFSSIQQRHWFRFRPRARSSNYASRKMSKSSEQDKICWTYACTGKKNRIHEIIYVIAVMKWQFEKKQLKK